MHSKSGIPPFVGHREDAGQLEHEKGRVVPAKTGAGRSVLPLSLFKQMGRPNIDEPTARLSMKWNDIKVN